MAGGPKSWPRVSKKHFSSVTLGSQEKAQVYDSAGMTETIVESQRSTEKPKYQNRCPSTPKTVCWKYPPQPLSGFCCSSSAWLHICTCLYVVSGPRLNSLTTPNVPSNRVFLIQAAGAGLCHMVVVHFFSCFILQ